MNSKREWLKSRSRRQLEKSKRTVAHNIFAESLYSSIYYYMVLHDGDTSSYEHASHE